MADGSKYETELILQWINRILGGNVVSSIGNLRDSVVWFQLLDKLLKGKVTYPMIIERPKNSSEIMHNYLLLKVSFDKCGLSWDFEVKDLMSGNIDELMKLAKYFVYIYGIQYQPTIRPTPRRHESSPMTTARLPPFTKSLDSKTKSIKNEKQPKESASRRTSEEDFYDWSSIYSNRFTGQQSQSRREGTQQSSFRTCCSPQSGRHEERVPPCETEPRDISRDIQTLIEVFDEYNDWLMNKNKAGGSSRNRNEEKPPDFKYPHGVSQLQNLFRQSIRTNENESSRTTDSLSLQTPKCPCGHCIRICLETGDHESKESPSPPKSE